MDEYVKELNSAMVNVYDLLSRLEEQMVSDLSNMKLSIRELHMLEYIAEGETGRTIGEIAQNIGITPPSVTIAIKKLDQRGYVEKIKNSTDGRHVHVVLTRMGRKVNSAHKYYHIKMMRKVASKLNKDEEAAFISGLKKLEDFFADTIQKQEMRTQKR